MQIKLDLQNGRRLTQNEFNHFMGRAEYVRFMRNRLLVSTKYMDSDYEINTVEKHVVGWLSEHASDLYFVKFELANSEYDHNRLIVYMLEKNDAFAMKMALQGTQIETRGW